MATARDDEKGTGDLVAYRIKTPDGKSRPGSLEQIDRAPVVARTTGVGGGW